MNVFGHRRHSLWRDILSIEPSLKGRVQLGHPSLDRLGQVREASVLFEGTESFSELLKVCLLLDPVVVNFPEIIVDFAISRVLSMLYCRHLVLE